ncbi:Fe2+-dependent dioxygenase [Novosphingobium sp. SL115]|uniref:Fe2+-dependent dioxygenase n=1 Tax=Novosphingobium sp. SL115 TaxID=2995150 RepID=UPI002274FDD1|nr:Fe2+-dependent dioxygenase [Novosphingobium sp. SL115]MCY1670076.1 Fe2+-dependent dioxygenase [Novosphingobium sp. SL115]
MLLPIPALIGPEDVAALRAIIDAAPWEDGNATSGHQARLVKNNRQLPEDGAAAQQAGQIVLTALASSPLFIAAALPHKIYPPMFNSYSGGQTYGLHVDNAVRVKAGTDWRVRSDLSMTVFLEDPAHYDGGELTIETRFGAQSVKLAAGDAILYPSSSLHMVQPVTRGCRVASFFWIQSMVRDDMARTSLFDLDQSIQTLATQVGQDNPSIVRLTGVYHNLLRQWAEA